MTNVPRRSKVFRPGITQGPPKSAEPKPLSDRADQALMYARENAKSQQVMTCDLLLGILQANEGLAAQVLMNFGVTFDKAKAEVEAMTGGKR